MKITIKKTLLEQILSQMQPFLEKKDMSQITSHIYLNATGEELEIKATDYESGLESRTGDVEIAQEGKVTANGKKLLDIVRILKEGEITLQREDDHLVITQNRSKFKLPMFNPEEFPQFPSVKDLARIELPSRTFIDSLRKIAPAIDSNNPKFELNGALIDIKGDRINFVATDTKRLALISIPKELDRKLHLIIPKKAINEIQKIFFDDLTIFYNEREIIITNREYLFFSRLINGRYPDYERIIPQSLRYTLQLPKGKMVEAIRQITIISSEIQLTFLPKRIIFKNLSDDNIEAQTEIEVETPFTEEFTMALNSRYLLDFLAQIEEESFEMGINEADIPFELKSGNFITIIMPIVI
ncbi:MAG: DNA polymerase III subunit beta [Epsilonproteobacteria bacterium]|nr:DNA polymerase III subunit beta [Campylobacterota bacterium]NPA56978.1 DNA polymerase III subunit beta [Campylobacterota bacterium]